MSVQARRGVVFVGAVAVAVLAVGVVDQVTSGDPGAAERTSVVTADTVADTTTSSAPQSTTTTVFVPRTDVLVDPQSFGLPWGAAVPGVLTFRGNPTRSWYGTGPMPRTTPEVLWQYPGAGRPMCGESSEYGQVRTWCGTGWTGQPAVFEREGRTWVVFGAYDHRIHFVDAATGTDILPPFRTGDLAKGNVTVDPDGFPLVYAGSRDNKMRVIAIDGTEPRELWSVDARTEDRMHNDDWDAAPLVVAGHLVTGAENSWFYGIRLNRGYAADGSVTVSPRLAFRVPGWDDQLVADLANQDPRRVSLEASVAISGDTAWLNSSGGLVQGWDLSSLRTGTGQVRRTFRFWTGDDSDATIVPDAHGYLYVGVEVDRNNRRVREVGQLLKLDPSRPDDPVVWSIDVNNGVDSGTWAAPVVLDDVVIWNTKPGKVYGIDRATGAILWRLDVAAPVLSSPVVVDGVLVQGDGKGVLHAYDVSRPREQPVPLWTVDLGANIESSPVVWEGRIYVGTRGGYVYSVGSRG